MCPTRLILASGSPRRKALLCAAGLRFDVIESGISEMRAAGEAGRDYALRIACEKALSVSARVPGALVLAADTVVICDDKILVKPNDQDEARRMLAMLSGRTHTVVTAYALATASAILEAQPILSQVTFRPLSSAEIDEYVATGEPMDKAGAYGIQGRGSDFIAMVVGSRDNVMGLPVREVLAALARLGILPEA
ncbi:MAG: septum formation inhibitor Maf [Deltaproteobacteria bacterium]|nr:septum formation inhibitor Maf [Deltaproteobacteria bacterium]